MTTDSCSPGKKQAPHANKHVIRYLRSTTVVYRDIWTDIHVYMAADTPHHPPLQHLHAFWLALSRQFLFCDLTVLSDFERHLVDEL
jgi:hypothetical protein